MCCVLKISGTWVRPITRAFLQPQKLKFKNLEYFIILLYIIHSIFHPSCTPDKAAIKSHFHSLLRKKALRIFFLLFGIIKHVPFFSPHDFIIRKRLRINKFPSYTFIYIFFYLREYGFLLFSLGWRILMHKKRREKKKRWYYIR